MLQLRSPNLFGMYSTPFDFRHTRSTNSLKFVTDLSLMPLVIKARGNTRRESAKVRNRRMLKKTKRNELDYVAQDFGANILDYTCLLIHGYLTSLHFQYNGTPTKPRLSVFCSDKQLYAMLVDDQNKKCLFYGSTLQKSIRQNSPCSTIEAAKRVGEELIEACNDLKINEISSYDRNGLARGERMQAFEIAISSHGFLPR
ncbi:hypothetical protein TIFTF001_011092 [Ficus carica]|uniref:Ribosomal protein L18 n=1 Tax=Ficus carica TaxID=3494 RepID=A0AA87ZR23_FICCA|nr:hypothetical protein TIFTF001_011092 [Ficus carica]